MHIGSSVVFGFFSGQISFGFSIEEVLVSESTEL